MGSRRRRIIISGILLVAAGAIIPVALVAWLSIHISTQKELALLDEFAARTLTRAARTFDDARAALHAMASNRTAPCSAEHIAEMRDATIHSPAAEEIGYFENGLLKCSSWGMASGAIRQTPPDYVTGDGLQVTLRIKPLASFDREMTAIQLGQYNVLVLPLRFIDVLARDDTTITVMNDRGQILDTNAEDERTSPHPGSMREGNGLKSGHLYGEAEGNGLKAVLSEPRDDALRLIANELPIYLLIGGLCALASLIGVLWLSKRRLSLRAELERGIQNQEFLVHYQPIIELESGLCVGAEALVRWERPDETLVKPDLFIPLAEETGLIEAITDQVIDAVIRDLDKILIKDRSLHIAINIAATDIQSGRAIDMIGRKIADTGIRAEQIWIEATERGFIDVDAASATLTKARHAGHSVAIDDFGTGYSSLAYLQHLPLDALKIDKSFVDTIGIETATSSVVLHIIEMAKDLGLFSVAEGIETDGQLEFLKRHGVDYGQGWLFAKPLPVAKFLEFHRSRKAIYGEAREIIRKTSSRISEEEGLNSP